MLVQGGPNYFDTLRCSKFYCKGYDGCDVQNASLLQLCIVQNNTISGTLSDLKKTPKRPATVGFKIRSMPLESFSYILFISKLTKS